MASKAPTPAQALGSLRLVFVLAFGAQMVLALGLGLVLGLVTGAEPAARRGGLLGGILFGFTLLQLPLALGLSLAAARAGGKQAALSATILAAVLLATPAWFAALLLALRGPLVYLLALLGLLLLYYGVGFVLCGRFAQQALEPEPSA